MKLNSLFVLLIVVAVIAALLAKPRRRSKAGLREAWPLQPRPTLLTDPEQVLYRRLVQALPGHIVLAQVQLSQALRFRRGAWSPGVFNRICQLSVDFLILKPDTSIVAAVELDDASHDRPDRRDADARKEHALFRRRSSTAVARPQDAGRSRDRGGRGRRGLSRADHSGAVTSAEDKTPGRFIIQPSALSRRMHADTILIAVICGSPPFTA